MPKEFDEKRSEVDKIMKDHHVDEWKLFEDIPSFIFPTKAFVHFLVIPGDKFDLTQMRKLKATIKKLFPVKHLEFYTPDDLNALVDQKKLGSEIRNLILNSTPERRLEEKKPQSEIESQYSLKFLSMQLFWTKLKIQEAITPDTITPELIGMLIKIKLDSLPNSSEREEFLHELLKKADATEYENKPSLFGR